MAQNLALKVHDSDNVATVFANNLFPGMVVEMRDKQGRCEEITLLASIPYGHKIALEPIKAGQPFIKYGEVIGTANRDVEKGDHVHVHNLDSQRGRGDLA